MFKLKCSEMFINAYKTKVYWFFLFKGKCKLLGYYIEPNPYIFYNNIYQNNKILSSQKILN